MFETILLYGSAAAVIHFLVVGLLYMNPLVDRLYRRETGKNPALRVWNNKKHYMILMFSGSLVECWLLAMGYLLLRGAFAKPASWEVAAACALLLGLIRIYPRAFDKWIQTTYPSRLIAVEAVNGLLGSAVVILSMRLLMGA